MEERERREAEENRQTEQQEREQQLSNQQQTLPSARNAPYTSPQLASPPPDRPISTNPYAAYLNATSPIAATPPVSPRSNNPYHVSPLPNESSTTDANNNYNFDFLDTYTDQPDLQAPLEATSPFRSTPAKSPTARGGERLEIVIPPVSTLKLEDTDDESIKTPLQPSEKALGKMKSSSYSTKDS